MFTTLIINEKYNYKSNILKYDTDSLPYYILNLNIDIDKIKSLPKVTDICFSNLSENINLFKINNKDIYTCPIRDNLIEYMNWYINSIDILYNELIKGKIIEIPLFNIKLFYYQLFNKLKNKKISIYKSIYFHKYIDCLYMYIDSSVKNDNITEINTIEDFNIYMNTQWIDVQIKYINVISSASQYVTAGNYYGYEASKYEKERKEFIELNNMNNVE